MKRWKKPVVITMKSNELLAHICAAARSGAVLEYIDSHKHIFSNY